MKFSPLGRSVSTMTSRTIRRRGVLAPLAGVLAAGAAALALAFPGGGAGAAIRPIVAPAPHTLPTRRLVALAKRLADGLGDPRVKTAWVVVTTQWLAENATYPGSEPRQPHSPRAYLVLVRGRFVCGDCSRPSGAKAPSGNVAYDIWVPGSGITDFGLQSRVPPGVYKLGPIITLPLVSQCG